LIHGFLELHRHRLQGAQAPQRARAGLAAMPFANLPEAEIAERHKHISLEDRMHSFLTCVYRKPYPDLSGNRIG
jgi:hypothetical protein